MARRWTSTDPYPQGVTFGELLEWHLTVWGTNEKATTTERATPWVLRSFATAVHSGLPEGEDENAPERKLRHWRAGTNLPDPKTEHRIFSVLFGTSEELAEWRRDLQNLLDKERASKALRPADTALPQKDVLRFPRPTGHFLGRKDAVEALAGILASPDAPSAILVQGGPGIGKTELTKATAHHADVADYFAMRRFFVPLEAAPSAVSMQDAIARAVHGDGAQSFAAAMDYLNEEPSLLVLDNLETPWTPADQRQAVEETLSEITELTNVALLASFRGRDAVGGARWHEYELDALPTTLAIELFASHAGDWIKGDPQITTLALALGGIPLAIQLVARRAHGRTSLAPLWEEWQKIGAELAKRPGFEPGRLTSLPHSIELSLRPMAEHPALRLLAFLGQLPAGIARSDVERLLGGDAFDAVERLCHAGIAHEVEQRVDLLPPIREHARRHYNVAEADDAAWVAHYIDLAGNQGPIIGTADDTGLLQALSPELPNIEAAFHRSMQTGRCAAIAEALPGFSSLAFTAGRSTDIFLELGAFFSVYGDVPSEALSHKTVGDLARARSDLVGAAVAYDVALAAFRQCNDQSGVAMCQLLIGEIAIHRGDLDTALSAHAQALAIYDEAGDKHGAAGCVKGIGEIALVRCAYDEARSRHEEAAALYAESQNPLGVANCHLTLAEIALMQGQHDIAQAQYLSTLNRYESMGYLLGQANAHHGLGNVAFDLADYVAAWSSYDRALELYEATDNALGQANCAQCFGDLAIALEEIDHAQEYFENALDRYRRIGDLPVPLANCIKGLGDVAFRRGDLEGAEKVFRLAKDAYEHCGNLFGEADCVASLGDIAVRRADYPAARQQFNHAIGIYRQIGNAAYEQKCLRKIAEI